MREGWASRWPCTGLAALTVVRLVVAATVPLSPDESYYRVWSRALAAGYLDHPPMVALWIRARDARGRGWSALGIRLLAPLAAALGSWLLWDAERAAALARAWGGAGRGGAAGLDAGAGCRGGDDDPGRAAAVLLSVLRCGHWRVCSSGEPRRDRTVSFRAGPGLGGSRWGCSPGWRST